MNGHSSSNGSNGKANGKAAAESLTAGNMYQLCLEARPYFGGEWFSLTDTATRLSLAFLAFYRFLLTQPLALLRFAYGWNTLWYGPFRGTLLTIWLPVLPIVLCVAELVKRIGCARRAQMAHRLQPAHHLSSRRSLAHAHGRVPSSPRARSLTVNAAVHAKILSLYPCCCVWRSELMPWAETDWKMAGPGRVFFERPPTLMASILWDFYLAISVFCGSFLQYGNDSDGLMHTWYA